jgi:metal-sulfur cluster biosynthetic enzyme
MIDPELRMNVVDLGLIYDIRVKGKGKREEGKPVYILMTLTTPGCPLAAVFIPMIRQALGDIPGFDPYNDLEVEITFDPPWHPGLMSQRAKAELGFE